MKDWYGRGDYPLRHLSNRSLVQTGMPAVPIRWVLIKTPPKESLNPKRSMHGLDVTPVQILMVSLSL